MRNVLQIVVWTPEGWKATAHRKPRLGEHFMDSNGAIHKAMEDWEHNCHIIVEKIDG